MSAGEGMIGGNHYREMKIDTWQVVDTWPIEQQIGFYRGGALKYLMRMGTKDERLQELRKGQHYISKLIEVLERHEKLESMGGSVKLSPGMVYNQQTAVVRGRDHS